jgi:hypothetical protein
MGAFGVILTVVVMVAVAVFILLFERSRAKQIESDLRHELEMRSERQVRRPPQK